MSPGFNVMYIYFSEMFGIINISFTSLDPRDRVERSIVAPAEPPIVFSTEFHLNIFVFSGFMEIANASDPMYTGG